MHVPSVADTRKCSIQKQLIRGVRTQKEKGRGRIGKNSGKVSIWTARSDNRGTDRIPWGNNGQVERNHRGYGGDVGI